MASDTCFPWWHAVLAPLTQKRSYVLASGCPIGSDGNASCSPEAMRAHAEALLRSSGWWPANKTLTLEVYTLARYVASEVGSGTTEERVAVGEAAVNRARLEQLPRGVLDLLLYRQRGGHPNRGYYGPIHGS